MWINFNTRRPYAIKVHVGGVNAVSGEPSVENAATQLRRQTRLSRGETIQDYVAVPNQLWLDGITAEAGKVRQFVAMPMGSGYSVEKQITGEEVTGGIQFEITPALEYQMVVSIDGIYGLKKVEISNTATVGELKSKLKRDWGIKFGSSSWLEMGGQSLDGKLEHMYRLFDY